MADDDDAQQLAEMSLEQLLNTSVSGSSRLLQRRSDASAAVTVINRQDFGVYGFHTLADVLRSVRGVVVTSDRDYTYLGVRGYLTAGDYNTRILLLIDGNRINDHLYDQAVLGDEFPLDLDQVERIEFIPGQGSAIYGANAVFGVVNVITRESDKDDVIEAAVAYGSFDERQVSVRANAGIEDGGLIVAASRTVSDGEAFSAVNHNDYLRRTALYASYSSGGFSGSFVHGDRIKGIALLPDIVSGDPRNWYRDSYDVLNVQQQFELADGAALTQRAFIGQYRFLGGYMIDYPPVTENRDDAHAKWHGLESRFVAERNDRQQIVLGAEWQRASDVHQINYDTAPEAYTYIDDRRSAQRGAVYAEDRVLLGQQWVAHVGARMDWVQGFNARFSPRVALHYALNDQWNFKWVYGTAFRTPNAFESYYEVDGLGGYARSAAIEEEHVRGLEGIVEWRPGRLWRISASAYSSHAQRMVQINYNADAQLYSFSNAGAIRLRGADVEVEYVHGSSRFRLNYSFSEPDAGNSSLMSTVFPRRMLKGLATTPLMSRWILGVEGNAVGRRGLASGYSLFNLTLSRPIGMNGAGIELAVRNALDHDIEDPGIDDVAAPVFPQPGLTWRATLRAPVKW